MKSAKTSTLLIALLAFIFSATPYKNTAAQPYGSVSFDLFYEELSPYGYWDRDPSYGDIWYPNVGRDFRPYGTNGYWTMTEYGNTWVSNYDWGWAPFHYGRWIYTPSNRWAWIPGYEWGPAWVEWRSGADYYGWAPMQPSVRVSVSVGLPLNFWVFIPARRIYDRSIHRHWRYGDRVIYNRTTIINNTYIVNNNRYYGGPGRRDIERHLGRRVDVRTIRTADRPGRSRVDSRSVSIYRPDRSNSGSVSRNNARRTEDVRGSRGNSNTPQTRRNERYIGDNPARGNGNSNQGRVARGNTPEVRSSERTTGRNRSNERPAAREARSSETRANRNTGSAAQPQVQRAERSRGSQQVDRSRGTAERPRTERRQPTPNRNESRSRNQESGRAANQRVYQAASQRSSTPAQVSRQHSGRSESSRGNVSRNQNREQGNRERGGGRTR